MQICKCRCKKYLKLLPPCCLKSSRNTTVVKFVSENHLELHPLLGCEVPRTALQSCFIVLEIGSLHTSWDIQMHFLHFLAFGFGDRVMNGLDSGQSMSFNAHFEVFIIIQPAFSYLASVIRCLYRCGNWGPVETEFGWRPNVAHLTEQYWALAGCWDSHTCKAQTSFCSFSETWTSSVGHREPHNAMGKQLRAWTILRVEAISALVQSWENVLLPQKPVSLGKLDLATSEGRQAIRRGGLGIVTVLTWTACAICPRTFRGKSNFALGAKECHKNHATHLSGRVLGTWGWGMDAEWLSEWG